MSSTPHVPTSIDGISADWLSGATGLDVDSVRAEQIGVGIGVSSAVYRLHLSGQGCPSTMVAKLPALDEAAVFTSTVLRMYLREVGFFRQLAAESPVRVPSCFTAAADETTGGFVVLMEDMAGKRIVDQLEGMDLTDAERAVDELAAWHATWWGRGPEMAAAGLAVALGDPIYPAVLPMVFAEGWEKVTSSMDVPPALLPLGPRFGDLVAPLLAHLDRGPATLTHGDFRADNLMFDSDGSLILLDFQLIGSGRGAYDLAYFVTQSLAVDVASRHERALFDRWVDGLRRAGVPAADVADAWEDYRHAALFCLAYPIVASRGMDLAETRQRELVTCMNERFARAVEELGLTDLA